MASISDPVPLIVVTRMLFGDTNGSPYLYDFIQTKTSAKIQSDDNDEHT